MQNAQTFLSLLGAAGAIAPGKATGGGFPVPDTTAGLDAALVDEFQAVLAKLLVVSGQTEGSDIDEVTAPSVDDLELALNALQEADLSELVEDPELGEDLLALQKLILGPDAKTMPLLPLPDALGSASAKGLAHTAENPVVPLPPDTELPDSPRAVVADNSAPAPTALPVQDQKALPATAVAQAAATGSQPAPNPQSPETRPRETRGTEKAPDQTEAAPLRAGVADPASATILQAKAPVSLAPPIPTVFAQSAAARQFQLIDSESDSLVTSESASIATPSSGDHVARPHLVNMSPTASSAAARQIVPQIIAEVTQNGRGTTEIQLSPKELGRLRLSLSTPESGAIVIIAAERPETADLIRRNLGALDQEMRDLGYENVEYRFDDPAEQGNAGDQGDRREAAQPGGIEAPDVKVSTDAIPRAAPPPRLVALDHLDMRL